MISKILLRLLTTALLLLLGAESKSNNNKGQRQQRIRHIPLINQRAYLKRRSRELQIEIIEEDDLDRLYQGYGTHYVDLDVGKTG